MILTFITWLRQILLCVSTGKLVSFALSKRITLPIPQVLGGELCSTSLRWGDYLHNFAGNSLYGRFVSHPHFICFYQYRLMETFYALNIIQHYIILLFKFFQLWTWVSLSISFKYLTYVIFLLPEEVLVCILQGGSTDNEFLTFICKKTFISPLLKDKFIEHKILSSHFLPKF